jgi:mannose-1-phosphate guanylyltransferase
MRKEIGTNRLWSIILAGGEGERTRTLVESWLGRHKPKQYCAFVGTRTMLEHTIDRADRIASSERRVIIIKDNHRRQGWMQTSKKKRGNVLLQPEDRGTAVGILLPLAFVRACDPSATVVIYPSDHFVYPEDRFIDAVSNAVRAVERFPQRLLLLAARPEKEEPEYGWIWPSQVLGFIDDFSVRGVSRFQEKPGLLEARAAMSSGALWNTLVIACKVETLWKLGWCCLPEIMVLLERFQNAVGTSREADVLAEVYRIMPTRNFSSDLLAYASGRIAVMEMGNLIWSDWGRPERIVETLSRLGKHPAFPLECLAVV